MIQEAITPKLKSLHLLSLGLGIATTGAVFVALPMTQAASDNEIPATRLTEKSDSSSPIKLSLPQPPEVVEFVFGPETIVAEENEPIELASNQPNIELAPSQIELSPGIGNLKVDASLPDEFSQL